MSGEFHFVVTAQAPLAINERKPGGSQYQEGLDYIPGRVLRGVLANLLLRTCTDPYNQHEHADCPAPALCRALFTDQLHFTDARPLGPTPAPAQGKRTVVQRLLPATAFSCKDESGFRSDGDHGGHGVFDTLIDRAVWELQTTAVYQYLPRCPTCGGRTRSIGGAYTATTAVDADASPATAEPSYRHEHVAKELLTRVAINRRRGVAEDQLLYAVSALSPHVRVGQQYQPARYGGSIHLSTTLAEQPAVLTALSAAVVKIDHIGSGRTRGLGKVQIEPATPPADSAVAERLAKLNDYFRERWQLAASLTDATASPPEQIFTITLQSDAIFSGDDDWSPGQRLTPARLWAACGETAPPPADLRLLRAYAPVTTRGGWNALWGLRKATVTVVEAGAVYLFAVADQAGWANRLARLETQRLGTRGAEGFGQVRACDEFHTIGEGNAV